MADDAFEIAILLDAGPVKAGVAEAIQAFNGMYKVMLEARDKAQQMADQTFRMRDSLRDIRALSGQVGVGDQVLKENLDFMQKTNLRAEEAHEFREAYGGEAEVYRERFGKGEYEKLEVLAGKYSAMVGGDPKALALMAGQIIAKGPAQGQTAENVMTEIARSFQEISLGSGKSTEATSAAARGVALLVGEEGGGQIGSIREASIIAAAASRFGGTGEIPTRMRQFTQGVLGQTASKNWNEFVREGLKVKEGEKAEDAMEKVFGFMEGKEKQGRNLQDVLLEEGLHEVRLRSTLVNMFNQRRNMRESFKGLGQKRIETFADVKERYAEADVSPEQQTRRAQIAEKTEEVRVGMEYEPVTRAMIQARANLLKQRVITPEQMSEEALMDWVARKGAGQTREQLLVQDEARRILEKETGVSMGAARGPGEIGRLHNWMAGQQRMVGRHTFFGEAVEALSGETIKAKDVENTLVGRIMGAGTMSLYQDYAAAQQAGGRLNMEQRLLPGPGGEMMTKDEIRQYGLQHHMSAPQILAMVQKAIDSSMAIDKKNLNKPMLPARPARGVRP